MIFQLYEMVHFKAFLTNFWERVILLSLCLVKWVYKPQTQMEYSLSFHFCAILPLVNVNVFLIFQLDLFNSPWFLDWLPSFIHSFTGAIMHMMMWGWWHACNAWSSFGAHELHVMHDNHPAIWGSMYERFIKEFCKYVKVRLP